MAMQHPVRVVMGATAMNMEVKHWAFVIFRLVSVSARTIQWVIIVTSANLATMAIQGKYFTFIYTFICCCKKD